MMILDLVVVNVALPTMQRDLHLGGRGALVAAGFSVAAALIAWLVLRPAERTAASPLPSESAAEPLARAA
jgi:hypothetical protein